jgi:hypothetical protein
MLQQDDKKELELWWTKLNKSKYNVKLESFCSIARISCKLNILEVMVNIYVFGILKLLICAYLRKN